MQHDARRIKVNLNNQEYTIVSTHDDEHVLNAAQMANEQLALIKQNSPQLSNEQACLLLALNTISKQLRLEQDMLKLKKQMKKLEIDSIGASQVNRVGQNYITGQKLTKQKDLFAQQTSIEDFSSVYAATHQEDVYKPAIFNQEG